MRLSAYYEGPHDEIPELQQVFNKRIRGSDKDNQ